MDPWQYTSANPNPGGSFPMNANDPPGFAAPDYPVSESLEVQENGYLYVAAPGSNMFTRLDVQYPKHPGLPNLWKDQNICVCTGQPGNEQADRNDPTYSGPSTSAWRVRSGHKFVERVMKRRKVVECERSDPVSEVEEQREEDEETDGVDGEENCEKGDEEEPDEFGVDEGLHRGIGEFDGEDENSRRRDGERREADLVEMNANEEAAKAKEVDEELKEIEDAEAEPEEEDELEVEETGPPIPPARRIRDAKEDFLRKKKEMEDGAKKVCEEEMRMKEEKIREAEEEMRRVIEEARRAGRVCDPSAKICSKECAADAKKALKEAENEAMKRYKEAMKGYKVLKNQYERQAVIKNVRAERQLKVAERDAEIYEERLKHPQRVGKECRRLEKAAKKMKREEAKQAEKLEQERNKRAKKIEQERIRQVRKAENEAMKRYRVAMKEYNALKKEHDRQTEIRHSKREKEAMQRYEEAVKEYDARKKEFDRSEEINNARSKRQAKMAEREARIRKERLKHPAKREKLWKKLEKEAVRGEIRMTEQEKRQAKETEKERMRQTKNADNEAMVEYGEAMKEYEALKKAYDGQEAINNEKHKRRVKVYDRDAKIRKEHSKHPAKVAKESERTARRIEKEALRQVIEIEKDESRQAKRIKQEQIRQAKKFEQEKRRAEKVQNEAQKAAAKEAKRNARKRARKKMREDGEYEEPDEAVEDKKAEEGAITQRSWQVRGDRQSVEEKEAKEEYAFTSRSERPVDKGTVKDLMEKRMRLRTLMNESLGFAGARCVDGERRRQQFLAEEMYQLPPTPMEDTSRYDWWRDACDKCCRPGCPEIILASCGPNVCKDLMCKENKLRSDEETEEEEEESESESSVLSEGSYENDSDETDSEERKSDEGKGDERKGRRRKRRVHEEKSAFDRIDSLGHDIIRMYPAENRGACKKNPMIVYGPKRKPTCRDKWRKHVVGRDMFGMQHHRRRRVGSTLQRLPHEFPFCVMADNLRDSPRWRYQ